MGEQHGVRSAAPPLSGVGGKVRQSKTLNVTLDRDVAMRLYRWRRGEQIPLLLFSSVVDAIENSLIQEAKNGNHHPKQ